MSRASYGGTTTQGVQLSVLLSVVAAIAAVTLISKYRNESALALGKVSSVISVTAVLAEAWSKTQAISKHMQDNPTQVALPSTAQPSQALVPTRRVVDEEDDFLSEHPSFGRMRSYNAYRPLP